MPPPSRDRLLRVAPLVYGLLALAVTGALPLAFTHDHYYPTGYYLTHFLLASGALAGLAWLPRWPGAPWLALLGILLAAWQVGESTGLAGSNDPPRVLPPTDPSDLGTWNPVALLVVCLGIALQGALLLLAREKPPARSR